jgi:hypothetical protein
MTSSKSGMSLPNREAHAASDAVCIGPNTSACFQSIAVTFGTATSSSIDAGFEKQRFEDLSLMIKCSKDY